MWVSFMEIIENFLIMGVQEVLGYIMVILYNKNLYVFRLSGDFLKFILCIKLVLWIRFFNM